MTSGVAGSRVHAKLASSPVDPNAGLSFAVWVNGDAAVAAPKATDINALVDLGWKEAVALKGKDIQRIEGKTK